MGLLKSIIFGGSTIMSSVRGTSWVKCHTFNAATFCLHKYHKIHLEFQQSESKSISKFNHPQSVQTELTLQPTCLGYAKKQTQNAIPLSQYTLCPEQTLTNDTEILMFNPEGSGLSLHYKYDCFWSVIGVNENEKRIS